MGEDYNYSKYYKEYDDSPREYNKKDYNDKRYQSDDRRFSNIRDKFSKPYYSSYERMSDLDYINRSENYRKIPQKRFRPENSVDNFTKPIKKHIPADPNNTIGVFGFNQNTKDEDVKKLLKDKLGSIKDYTFKLILDERTGLCKGFCFIDFKCLEDAINAKEILSFESFRGQDFKCDFSYKHGIQGEYH